MAHTGFQESLGTPLPLKPLVLSDQALALPLLLPWSQRNKVSVYPFLLPKAGGCGHTYASPGGSPML